MAPPGSSRSALPADIRTAWRRLGDPAALSLSVALIYLPFAFVGPLCIDPERNGGSVGSWFLVGVIGWLAFLATLSLVRLLIKPLRRGRSVATVVALVLSVVARSVALTLGAQALGLTQVVEFAYRLNAGILTQSPLVIASAIVVSSYVNHGRLASDLLARQVSLTQLSAESRSRLEQLRSQIAGQVRLAIEPLISQLNDISRRTGTPDDGIQKFIQHIVDEELRPLSHRLADAASVPTLEDESVVWVKTTRPPLPRRVSLGLLLRPLPSVLIVVLFAASQAVRLSTVLDALLFTFSLSASMGIVITVLRRILLPVRMPVWLGITSATLGLAVAFTVTVTLWGQTPVPMPPNLTAAAFYSGAIIGVLLALEYVVNERLTVTEDQLRASVQELQTHSSMLRQHEYMASRQLSYVVHGSVQSALNAAALRLSRAEDLDEELVTSIRSDIDEAISRIDTSGSAYVMLVRTLADLVELWEGTACIAWTMDHATIRVLAESPVTAASVGEIVTECTGNAIRHGRARHVKLSIQAVGNVVDVTVIDDGSGLPDVVQPRLGTRMLEELCVAWERSSCDAGTVVMARLATERALLPIT